MYNGKMISSYKRFAQVYDQLMLDLPYGEYVEWIKRHAPSNSNHTLLDVGCGTGTLSILFHQSGYQVSGIDLSEEMLSVASERFQEANVNIPLYAMSMDQMEGFAELDIVTIPIDSINYLQTEEAVMETLKRTYLSLKKGGHLFFDVHSLYKMDEIFLDSPFTYDDGEIAYIWYTERGEFNHSIYHQMTFFVKDEESGMYERFDEEHFQRTFPIETYVNWLKEIGFSNVDVTADWVEESPTHDSERIFIRATK